MMKSKPKGWKGDHKRHVIAGLKGTRTRMLSKVKKVRPVRKEKEEKRWTENRAGYLTTRVSAKREDFETEREYRNFLEGGGNIDWHYNFSTSMWGYGDDAREWNNQKEEYISDSEIEEIYLEKKGKAIIVKKMN